jgi:hypothetical protein
MSFSTLDSCIVISSIALQVVTVSSEGGGDMVMFSSSFFIRVSMAALSSNVSSLEAKKPYGNGNPPPAFTTTTTESIDYSIRFGFAALDYVVLEFSRMLHEDFVTFHREIRVLCFFSPIFACPASRNGLLLLQSPCSTCHTIRACIPSPCGPSEL